MAARDAIIPDAINWGNTDPSGQLKPGAASRAQASSQPQVLQTLGIAEDQIIPIIYGGPERIAGMPYTTCLAANGTDLVVSFIFCEGEIQGLANVELNDVLITGASHPGVGYNWYRGTQTGVDPILAAAIPGFNETLNGTAYLVIQIPAGVVQGFPKVTAEVMGLKIPDARAGGALGAWDNPALILAHFMRTYAKRGVNDTAANAAADFCDVVVGTGSTAGKRSRLTITLNEARDADEWIEVLRGYIPAWVVRASNGNWDIIPDTTSAPVLAYDADTDAKLDGGSPMALFKRGPRDVPNIVELNYTDTTVKPWTMKKAVASLPGIGTGQRRKASLALPGIRSYAQAYRFAVERLNHYTLETIEGELGIFDDGIRLLPGDIITITDSAHGWSVKPVRVLRADESDNGRWTIRFREFNALAYSTDAPAAPLPPNSGTLPNPGVVAPITGLTSTGPTPTVVEVLRFEKEGGIDKTDAIGRGLIWQSRIQASWNSTTDVFFDFYEVSLKSSLDAQPSVTTSKLAQFMSDVLVQGITYTLSVRVVNSLGFAGAWSTVNLLVQGKTAKPSNVTTLDFAAEIGGEVILRWRNVPDVDVIRYEWRSLATSATSASWESMALAARVDGNYTRLKGFTPGQLLLAVKAIDAHGEYSVSPLFVSVNITSDSGSFLSNFDFAFQDASSFLTTNAAGNYAQTPDSAQNSVTGDFELRAWIKCDSYTYSYRTVISKGDYLLHIPADGKIAVYGSAVTVGGVSWLSTIPIGNFVAGGVPIWIRAAIDIDNGAGGRTCRFFYSKDGDNWTLYETITNAGALTAMNDSANVLEVGSQANGTVNAFTNGVIYRAQVWRGIDTNAQLVADMNADDWTAGATWYARTTGETWTLTGAASVTIPAAIRRYDMPISETSPRPLPRWITRSSNTWNAAMPNPVASLSTPVVAAFGRNGAWVARSDVWDFGLVLEATVTLNLAWTKALKGNMALYLANSQDGAAWDYTQTAPLNQGVVNGVFTAKITARFLKCEVYSNLVTDSFMQEGRISAQVSSQTRSESGSATSSASAATRCNLAQRYTKAVSITITPNGSTFATGSYNNVTVGIAVNPNYFDVYLFNAAGAQIAQAFSWTFRGV